MIIDKNLEIGLAQAVTVTAASTSFIDQGAAGDAMGGQELYFTTRVDTAFTTGDSAVMTVALQCDDNTSFSSPKTLATTATIAAATLVAGYRPLIVKIPVGCERYIRAYYTVTVGSMTAGKIDARLVKDIDLRAA